MIFFSFLFVLCNGKQSTVGGAIGGIGALAVYHAAVERKTVYELAPILHRPMAARSALGRVKKFGHVTVTHAQVKKAMLSILYDSLSVSSSLNHRKMTRGSFLVKAKRNVLFILVDAKVILPSGRLFYLNLQDALKH